MSSKVVRALLVLAVLAGGVEFVVRGPVRFLRHGDDRSTDFTGPYLGARALARGLNPYSQDVFWTMAEEVGWTGGRTYRTDDFESRSPYPLTTFVLMAPLAGLDRQAARLTATVVTSALLLAAIVTLGFPQGFRNVSSRQLAFLALALALAPLHSGLGTGNVVSAAVACALLGAASLLRNRLGAAGVWLALAACLKPPIAAPILGYALLRGRWRAVGIAAAVSVAVLAIGALRLAGTPWLADYITNNSMLLADRGVAIIAWSPQQQQFINLQYLAYQLFHDSRLVNVVSLLLGGGLVGTWLAGLWHARGERGDAMLEVGAAAVISLLPIYHRVYDAGLLLLPLCWALLSQPRSRTVVPRGLTLALMLPFFVSGSTWIEQQGLDASPAWWQGLVVPHQVWALLAMAIVLLWAMPRAERG